jgi:DNA replication protein DnaC
MPPEVAAPECPECEGRGWVLQDDGGAGTARPCDCRRNLLAPQRLTAAGIPERYRGATFEGFKPHGSPADQEQQLAARRRCQQYVERFLSEEGGFAESGLIFVGATGVGKTHLAVAVLKEVIERWGVRGRFVDFTSLIFEIQSTFEPGSALGKSSVLAPVTDAEVLVLDDLGAHKASDWVNEILYLILNGRYARKLPTLFTTNYSLGFEPKPELNVESRNYTEMGFEPRRGASRGLDPLGDRISHRLVSRLFEMADVVSIEAPDIRLKDKVPKLI